MTVICVLVACLFPGAGYDTVLATAFGLPGLKPRPGAEVPSGSAFSQARKLLGEQAVKRIFELDAAVADADLGIGLLWKGLEVTALDGTTMELATAVLEGEFGIPADGARRCCGSPRTSAPRPSADRRQRPAATTTGRTPWPTSWKAASGPACSTSPTAGLLHAPLDPVLRHRRGAGLADQERREWVPLKTLRTLPDGSELVMLHESDGMRTRRRRDTQNPQAERLPDTIARLVTFTVTAATRSGRTKTTVMRVLTTLLDHEAYPGLGNRRPVCREMANRNRVPSSEADRARSPPPAARPVPGTGPPEAWALLLIHNITATATARAAGPAGLDPGLIPFTAVLSLIRAHVAAEAPSRHCGHRPDSPLASLNTAILALPRHRPGHQRTSSRTTAERRTRHTEEVTYTIGITKSNLPKWDTTPET